MSNECCRHCGSDELACAGCASAELAALREVEEKLRRVLATHPSWCWCEPPSLTRCANCNARDALAALDALRGERGGEK